MRYENMDALAERHLDEMLALAFEARAGESPSGDAEAEAVCARAWARFGEALARRRREARRARRRAALGRGLRAAACLVLAVGVAAPIAVATNADVRSRVLRLVMRFAPEYAELELAEDVGAAFTVPGDWTGTWYPSWVPERFGGPEINGVIPSVRFVSADGREWLEFMECDENTTMNLDTEKADVEWANVEGRTVMVVSKGFNLDAVWSTDDRYLLAFLTSLDGTPDEGELLRIVAGVRRVME